MAWTSLRDAEDLAGFLLSAEQVQTQNTELLRAGASSPPLQNLTEQNQGWVVPAAPGLR